MEHSQIEHTDCPLQSSRTLMLIKDALDTIQGKWRIRIIAVLLDGPKRFRELSTELETITDRMLSLELKNLEINMLISKKIKSRYRTEMEYELTRHGYTLKPLISELIAWGDLHRSKITEKLIK
ncbi:winged helix-turn-helix transcriptional regulator [Sphingobacterium spiritivorum]|uniref:Transcriptional regulator, HxlR family n=1 Tax=Sphingobacterium spiritivorum ATCC 33861 TaxID=525373 RepID=D7VPP7_SPHSI|nr:helix-turn-helix domain-containing protein [Sphingobacterium spiritivorum]EFK57894.1 transcriptional regulator, HxlR family [Sphingobacterium spiritivorum ATCC 33861]QQT36086.1 helix-turn-helix transcriptional regulator [Sphingobacterium spiritivorum]WQD32818.1 helix-turn-helix domain-containing protein [Sphingobacterium spiritivorum]SUJ15093.1 Uncharacterized HTH-type transcriptional regulator yybR [Sphingobacterium spiritivorum]